MYTYVFAYYLQKNNQAHIFEQNQKDLEMATERLSEYLEREASGSSLVEMRQKVQDLSKYLDQRRKVLLDHVFEGYDQNLWDYAPDSMRAIMAAAS